MNKISINNIYLFSFFLLFFDAVLRMEQKSGITLDRIFFILPIILTFIFHTKLYMKFLFIYFIFFIYNFLLSSIYGSTKYFIQMSIHYFIIMNIALIVIILIKKKNANKIISLLYYIYLLFILTAFSQMLFGYHLPNVDIYPNGEVQTFFRVHNDMGVALMAGMPIVIMHLYGKSFFRIKFSIILLSIIFISFINDTKTALMAIFIFIFIFIFNIFFLNRKISSKFFIILGTLIVIIGSTITIYNNNLKIEFANETRHTNELIFDPIIRIATLDMYPMDSWGSVENRVNAAIIGIKVYINSFMIGIGYGNSVDVLEEPENQLKAAKSLHNDVLVWLLEFGLIVLFIYLFFIYKISSLLFKRYTLINNIRISILFSFPLGILSSSGVTSNYYFLISFFLLIFYKDNHENTIYNR